MIGRTLSEHRAEKGAEATARVTPDWLIFVGSPDGKDSHVITLGELREILDNLNKD